MANDVVGSIDEQHLRYLSLLNLQPGEVALDAGCGQGRTLVLAHEVQPEVRWVGLDNTVRFLARARAACPQAPLTLGEMRALPFTPRSLDVVYSRDTLECLPKPSVALEEFIRVLGPGGRLIVSHWDWDTQVFNIEDLGLCRKMVEAFADTKQAWMEHHDPGMGRKIRGLVHEQPGLEIIESGVTVLLETEWSEERFGFQQSQGMAQLLPARGSVSEAEAVRWLAELDASQRSGAYLYSVNHYWCLACRR
jgi:SAM-dependent methyltransferase